MCGITGIYNLKREGSFGEQVRRMNRCLAHRGPDNEGLYEAPGLALGHRRLSIIDLSAAGNQPMLYGNGRYTLIYNGELYNYRELKKELSDVVFHTAGDTEVVLAAYARWGEGCLSRLNGMYAFAIWDNEAKTLFIARDRLGIKPLYYYFAGNTLVFASEVRALLESGLVPRRLSKGGLGDFLVFQTAHAPETIIRDVRMLLPGHYLLLKNAQENETRYWQLGENRIEAAASEDYTRICRDVYDLLQAAVERRLVADVPFGAFLSGGIDSSAVVGLMSRVAKSKVKTFSVTFDESEFSEAKYAQLVAKKFQTEHHEIHLRPEDFLHDLPAALAAMDHPSGDGPNTYVVSKATKAAGITMALSGLGGDELFAGYDIFKRAAELRRKKWLGALPGPLRGLAGWGLRTMRPGVASDKIAFLLGHGRFDLEAIHTLSRRSLLPGQVKALLSEPRAWSGNASQTAMQAEHFFPEKNYLLSAVSFAEISTYMQNVLLRDTDQMSMAHALEVRVPFLDYTLVEYVLSVPDRFKYPHTPKKLLVDALGDLLPPEIVNRPKMGFTFPWAQWMKNELRPFCEERLQQLQRAGCFNEKGVQELWSAFLRDDPRVTWSRLWPLVVLGDWMQRNNIEA